MTDPRPDKVAEVEALEQRLKASSIVILTDYRGLTVGEIGALRGRLRGASLEYRVAKNTLLSRAAERAGVAGLDPYLTGPTAVVFGNDDVGGPARLLQDFIRQFRKLEIKGGVVEGQTLDAAGVQALATLPTRPELLARVVGAVQGPLAALVSVLNAAPRGLVTALEALRKQREAAGEPASVPGVSSVEGGPAEGAAAAGPPADLSSSAGLSSPAGDRPAGEDGPAAASPESPAAPPAGEGSAAAVKTEA